MAYTRKSQPKETPHDKRALRFLQVMEAVMAREMLLRREDVNSLLDISPPEIRSLMWLSRNGKTVMSDFADGTDVPLSTATRIVNRLVKKGLAVRTRSELDRRIVEVDLSPIAWEHTQRFRAKRQAALLRILAPLNATESEAVVALLEKGLRLSGPPDPPVLSPPGKPLK